MRLQLIIQFEGGTDESVTEDLPYYLAAKDVYDSIVDTLSELDWHKKQEVKINVERVDNPTG